MDPVSQSIASNVASGQYFKDAQAWHVHKYADPKNEKKYLLFCFCCFFLALLMVLVNVIELFPITSERLFVSFEKTSVGKSVAIEHLGTDNENPQKSLATYYASHYVTMRESYNHSRLAEQLTQMQNTSTPTVFKQFTEQVDANNALSPERLYQRQYVRSTTIQNVWFIGDENAYDRALVDYESIVKDQQNGQEERSQHVASIVLSLPDIRAMINKSVPIHFQVTAYHSSQVQQP
jgi:type IV secretory pathway component VirB8